MVGGGGFVTDIFKGLCKGTYFGCWRLGAEQV